MNMKKIWHYTSTGEFPELLEKYKGKVCPEIPCLVEIYHNVYSKRYFNIECDCWDGEEADDYDKDKTGYDKWCYIDDLIDME